MIRITQSYLIDTAIKYFNERHWRLLYYDKPGGRRSGVGLTARMNESFERIYNLSPDILLCKDQELLLLEVDVNLNEAYVAKYDKYLEKSTELITQVSELLKKPMDVLTFGFVSKKEKPLADIYFPNFRYLYFKRNKLNEVILNPS